MIQRIAFLEKFENTGSGKTKRKKSSPNKSTEESVLIGFVANLLLSSHESQRLIV